LDDIGETFLDEKRLLAVQSGQVKQVDGKQVGASSKGHIIYVEPATNVRLNQHQAQLRNEEKAEIFKILADLTDQLRSRKKDLEAFQRLLVRFDLYNAKVLFAKSYAGIIPKITDNKEFEWFNARHPLLYLEHQSTQEKTIGQDLYLSPKQRFLVISGPNAGGKSITLKTVGLVQMMFQSGLLVPLDLNSSCCWFDEVLSDIGDNQSIQDQLSTYSYRLKRMKYFLDSVNENTLLLLDEFGSGSDPELGGALAEVFFEQLYQKKCFAVITTHYANIKIITSELEEAINACMLFDTEKLNPLYRLSVGQPGSSFTFEVAALNGIDPQLVEAAKGKVSQSKLTIDELTAALQKEKSELKKLTAELQRKSIAANKTQNEYSEKLEKLQQKAEQQSAYLEQQAKYFSVGKRVFDYIKKYEKQETNKALNEAVKRLVGKEKSKITALKKAQADAKKKKEIKAALLMEQEIKAPDLPKSKQKKGKEKQNVIVEPKKQKVFKVGDFAQLKSTGQRGTITDISGNKATLEVGNFLITTKLSELS
jgi:DNA mismatch repair protein MutS2